MKRLFGLFMLLSLFVLAACSDTTPEVTAPGDAGTIASFRFDIDPSGAQVGVTALPGGLQTQEFQTLDPKTQLVLKNARYTFGADNTLTIEATFTNATTDSDFQFLDFSRVLPPEEGNYLSSTEPDVTDEDLGGDGVLSPGETTSTLTFTVKHKGKKFSYSVEASANVVRSASAGCGADGVFPSSVTIRTQADIDALRGCTRIEGNFYVNTDAETLDFSPLNSLRVVTGGFALAGVNAEFIGSAPSGEVNPNLTTLSGFDNLESVGGFIVIGNPSLTTLPEFPSLRSAELYFRIEYNASLTSVSGFDNLKQAVTMPITDPPGSDTIFIFSIDDNASLASISGFGQLEEISGLGFNVYANPALTTLSGFGNLRRTLGLRIYDNASLVSVAGFESLNNSRGLEDSGPRGSFRISNNPALTTLPEFGALVNSGSFNIDNNDALTFFSGFESLEEASSGPQSSAVFFSISNNDALESFSGFNNLRVVDNDGGGIQGSRFLIDNNPSLVSIPEFGALEVIEGAEDRNSFSISNNASLTSVSGFGKFNRTDFGSVNITNNASLITISGFESLTFVDPDDMRFVIGRLNISNNASLTTISGFAPFGPAEINMFVNTVINNNTVFDCSIPPQSNLPFLPVDESTGNLVNCPTE